MVGLKKCCFFSDFVINNIDLIVMHLSCIWQFITRYLRMSTAMLIPFLSVSKSQIQAGTVANLYRIRHWGRVFSTHCRQILELCEYEGHVSSSRLNTELEFLPTANDSRSLALAVSRRLPTAVAWVRLRVTLCGICGEQSGNGAGFLWVLPILIAPTTPYSLLILSSTLYSLGTDSVIK
jgi:hypothetical protein